MNNLPKKGLWGLIVLVLLNLDLSSQNVLTQEQWGEKKDSPVCGDEEFERDLEEVEGISPDDLLRMIRTRHREEAKRKRAEKRVVDRGTVYKIPVVVHVIHDYGPENITEAQIKDGMRVLNEDFRKNNTDQTDVISQFSGDHVDCEIEFELAKIDPQGNCTNGITRTFSELTHDGNYSMKQLVQWPQDQYLNIWVCASADGTGGYATDPSVAEWQPSSDGIVLRHDHMGQIGTGSHEKSRLLTHQAGHYLGLEHVWGTGASPGLSGNCNDDDGVGDTPNTIGSTTCDQSQTTCGSLDNVQNFMEEAVCSRMFTDGQKQWMRSALTSSTGGRNDLWTSQNLTATGTNGGGYLCAADFSSDAIAVCEGGTVAFEDGSFNGPTQWDWSFPGGNPSSSTMRDPNVTYNNSGSYDVTLEVSDGSQNKIVTKYDHITVLAEPGTPYHENFESISNGFPNGDIFPDNPSGDLRWRHKSGVGIENNGVSDNCIWLNNLNNAVGEMDGFHTRTIDATGLEKVEIYWDYAWCKTSAGDQDELRMYVSKDCGVTWEEKWSASGSVLATTTEQSGVFVPAQDDEWERVSVQASLNPDYKVDNLQVKFEMENDGGNNIYLDNLYITDPNAAGVEEVRKEGQGKVEVFPNPSRGERVKIAVQGSQKAAVKIYDMMGKEVADLGQRYMPEERGRITLNTEGLSRGVYTVKVTMGKEVVNERLILR